MPVDPPLQKVPVPVNYECLDGQRTHEKIQFAKFASGQEKHLAASKKPANSWDMSCVLHPRLHMSISTADPAPALG